VKRIAPALSGLILLILAACVGSQEPPAPPSLPVETETGVSAPGVEPLPIPLLPAAGIAYRCGPDAGFVVVTRADTVDLHLPSRTLRLTRAESASGARFASAEASFWSRGSEAVVEIDGNTLSGCRSDDETSPWADARGRGVRYRAVGQEPGWHIEVHPGSVSFVGDYGDTSWEGIAPALEVHPDGDRLTWRSDGDPPLELVVTDTPCFDVMSGEPFATTATVRLGSRAYTGCGRFLQ
jgi:uncharacterized membrane protein